ncbi:MAG TPA: SusC/RagA family TonB-linked outer membrane protein [Flavobacterium sp.]|nr:SusC/RagA family TonB-linked outer membrane protein [Flavobacterium sp.]
MKNLIRFTVFLLFSTSFSQVSAQDATGNVSDDKGLPLPGVNVTQASAAASTVTDLDGNFTIKAAPDAKLTFSMIGYESVTKTASLNMKIIMQESTKTLEEVVVVGYGTKKKGAITGSVVQVKSEDILKTPAQSAIQAIQGKAAGVNIIASDEPGAAPVISIRGLGTILSGRTPLYIIDGVETTGLNGLSANDIETIDILKDASSLSIYGNKGANGVIMITTKKGKKGPIKVTYDSYVGIKQIQNKVKMGDGYRFAYYNNVATGSSSRYNLTPNTNTDWLDEITGQGLTTNNAISLSGASETANYYLSASHYTEKGILNGTNYQRTNVSNRNQFNVFGDKVKITENINLSISKATPKPLSAFTNAYQQSPIMPVRYANGRYARPFLNAQGYNDMSGTLYNNTANPVAQLELTNEENKFLNLTGSIGAEIKLLKDLKFNSVFGAVFNWEKGYTFVPLGDQFLADNPTLEVTDPLYPVQYNSLEQRRINSFVWNWDNYLTYSKTLDKHKFTLTGGVSESTKKNQDYLNAKRYNVPAQSNYWNLDLSAYLEDSNPVKIIVNKHDTPIVSIAYFIRADYEFDSKYLLTASYRREGTSNFLPSKRWGNFKAISGGWVISNENFFKNIKFINYFKIRGGYGEVGNANIPNSINSNQFENNYNYYFGTTVNSGFNTPGLTDPNLTWESMNEIDLGFDFKFISNKLSATIDLYNRKSTDLILPVPYPDAVSPDPIYTNAGEVANKGAELALNWNGEINEKLRYSIGGNISYNENELSKSTNSFFTSLSGGSTNNGETTKEFHEGYPLGSFFVYETQGYNAEGGFKYSTERVYAGSYIPKYTYGGNVSIYYRNFDFSTDLYGVGGNKIYNGKKAQRLGAQNIEYDVLDDFWSTTNTNAANPFPDNGKPKASTYFIEDGSFLRINNITIGYTLPKVGKINKIRLYATAVNPFVFTKYSGYSPEVTGSDGGDPIKTAGIELDAYPTNKTFAFGVSANF